MGSEPLPEFENPPVVETVLSAQFEPIPGLRTVHFGLFWQKIRNEFPQTEEKPALDQAFERFDERPKRGPRFRFETREDARPERMWFINPSGTEMVQLQVDRFIKNWRKREGSQVYPRYQNTIRPGFDRDKRVFDDFLSEEKLGPVKVNQCEVTYVNHIVSGDVWKTWNQAARVFSCLSGMPELIEDGVFIIRIPIRVNDQNVGRLTVEIQSALRDQDEKPIFVMNLTARGMIGSGTEFLDIGREAIVRAFTDLTTSAMHSIWGRNR